MAGDVAEIEKIVINVEDEDGPEEGEIQDDSSDEGICPLENDSFKGRSFVTPQDMLFTEGRAKTVNSTSANEVARFGYPACVQEVYKGRPWTDKQDEAVGSRSHLRKGASITEK